LNIDSIPSGLQKLIISGQNIIKKVVNLPLA